MHICSVVVFPPVEVFENLKKTAPRGFGALGLVNGIPFVTIVGIVLIAVFAPVFAPQLSTETAEYQ